MNKVMRFKVWNPDPSRPVECEVVPASEYDALFRDYTLLCQRDAEMVAQRDALKAERDELVELMRDWCAAVDYDSSWDGWDHHYKDACALLARIDARGPT